jgi:sugar lactone lactonase YvrE
MNRLLRLAVVATTATLAVSVLGAVPASAQQGRPDGAFPTTIALPDGFQPEGIATGPGPFAYFGSRATGQIYRANLATGTGRIISPATGTPSLGLKTDLHGRLFVSGGSAGNARVIDRRTGAVLASYQFATAPTFINDVVLTRDAAYFTDSNRAVLYKVPFGRGGALPAANGFVTIPLTGDFVLDPAALNANGISRTPDGKALLIVQTATGLLFRVDPATGVTKKVDVGADSFPNGDGLLLIGRTLYVVQNRLNTVASVKLNRTGTAGTVTARHTDPRLDVPTTVAAFGDRLYLPNARFTTPPTPTTTYAAIAIPQF